VVAVVRRRRVKLRGDGDTDPQDMLVEAAYDAYEDAGLEDRHKQIEAGVLVRLVGRLDDHVLGVLVPVLAELRAAHADDGDLVADGVRVHGDPLSAPACTSSSSSASRPRRASSGRRARRGGRAGPPS